MPTRVSRGCARSLGLAVATFGLSAVFTQSAPAAPAGTLDPSFAGDGRKTTDFLGHSDHAEALAIDERRRIVVAGTAKRNPRCDLMGLARYRPDGSLDRRFADGGKVVIQRFGSVCGDEATAIAIQDNDKIVVAGEASIDVGIVRLRRNGELDGSFGDGGKVVTNIDPGWNRVGDVAIQSDGKIVVVGHTHGVGSGIDYLIIARYMRDGTLDETFGDGGILVTRFGEDTYVRGYGIAIQPDGKLVVSGEVGNSWILARFMPDGELDASFGNDGGVAHGGPVAVGQAFDVALQPDGRIVAAGVEFSDAGGAQFAATRNLADGSPDPSFGDGGGTRFRFGPERGSDFASSLALQADGRIVIAGSEPIFERPDTRFAVARLRPDGRLDKSFSKDGRVRTGFPQHPPNRHDDFAEAVAIQPNGRIVVAGSSEGYRAPDDFAIARYLGRRGG